MKKCPYCLEEIQDDAKKCRYCGEFLKKKNKWPGCLLGCLALFAASIILPIISVYLMFLLVKFIVNSAFWGTFNYPSENYGPYPGGGLEGVIRGFTEMMRSLWDKILGILQQGGSVKTTI